MTKDQEAIEALLARRIGLDPGTVGPHMVLRTARRRMAELGLDDLGVYASRVGHSEPELQALIEEVVVPESWFFRDERPFLWLADYVAIAMGERTVAGTDAGPEPGVRRRRGAVLDRDHAAGASACRPAGSGSTRWTSAPVG